MAPGDGPVQQESQQLLWSVEVFLHPGKMVGEGDDEGNFEQLGGLEVDPQKRDRQPVAVVHPLHALHAKRKQQQEQAVAQHGVPLPQPRHQVVVDFGEHNRRRNTADCHRRLHQDGVEPPDLSIDIEAVD